MAEGTCFAKMEAITSELQKNQGMVNEKLINVESRMSFLEEVVDCCKESMANVEVMMLQVKQPSKEKSVDSTSASNPQLDLESLGIFIVIGLKMDVPRSNGLDAED